MSDTPTEYKQVPRGKDLLSLSVVRFHVRYSHDLGGAADCISLSTVLGLMTPS